MTAKNDFGIAIHGLREFATACGELALSFSGFALRMRAVRSRYWRRRLTWMRHRANRKARRA